MPSETASSTTGCAAFSLQLAELAERGGPILDPVDSSAPADVAAVSSASSASDLGVAGPGIPARSVPGDERSAGELTADTLTARHVSGCLRCQAELAQYRKLLRALAALRHQTVAADPDLLDGLLEALRPPATVHRLHRISYRNRKAAYIGGIAAAATGVTAGAIVLASRLASKQKLAS